MNISSKNRITPLILILLSLSLCLPISPAQVVITQSNLPGNGSIIRKAHVNSPSDLYFPTPDTGNSLTWNFNFLHETPKFDTLHFLTPANAPHITQYPLANLVIAHSQNYYYYQKTNDGLYLLGIESPNNPFHPAKPLTWYKYPLKMGTSFVDSVSSVQTFAAPDTSQYDSIMHLQILFIQVQAIADGKLTYNNNSPKDVVKERLKIQSSFQIYAKDPASGNWKYLNGKKQNYVTYRWTSQEIGFSEVELTYNESQDSLLSLNYIEGAIIKPSSILSPKQSPFQIFPNPAPDHLFIIIPPNISINTIEIYNLQGVPLFTLKRPTPHKTKRLNLPLNKLPQGLYLLKISTTQGETFWHKFLKQPL